MPVLKMLPCRLQTLYPPDTTGFHPSLAQNNKQQQRRVVFVGRNCEKKGITASNVSTSRTLAAWLLDSVAGGVCMMVHESMRAGVQ